jgi:large subunit ribosomal protein L31e
VSEIRKFATAMMSTKTVKVDVELNKFVWHKGIRNVPTRVRVKLARTRNEDEDSKEKMCTTVTLVPVHGRSEFRNLTTSKDAEEEE